MFSIGVVDLFYSIPQSQLLDAIVSCIERNSAIGFQNNASVSLDNFIALLQLYISSTIVSYRDKFFVQKNGTCIGSCMAPVLCNICLSGLDRVLSTALEEEKVLRCFKYVDDF